MPFPTLDNASGVFLPDKEHYLASSLIPTVRFDPTCAVDQCTYGRTTADSEDHDPVELRPCGHVFGRQCILAWFNSDNQLHNLCPVCSKTLFLHEEVVTRGHARGRGGEADLRDDEMARQRVIAERYHRRQERLARRERARIEAARSGGNVGHGSALTQGYTAASSSGGTQQASTGDSLAISPSQQPSSSSADAARSSHTSLPYTAYVGTVADRGRPRRPSESSDEETEMNYDDSYEYLRTGARGGYFPRG